MSLSSKPTRQQKSQKTNCRPKQSSNQQEHVCSPQAHSNCLSTNYPRRLGRHIELPQSPTTYYLYQFYAMLVVKFSFTSTAVKLRLMVKQLSEGGKICEQTCGTYHSSQMGATTSSQQTKTKISTLRSQYLIFWQTASTNAKQRDNLSTFIMPLWASP